jgi:hypothetical protein
MLTDRRPPFDQDIVAKLVELGLVKAERATFFRRNRIPDLREQLPTCSYRKAESILVDLWARDAA